MSQQTQIYKSLQAFLFRKNFVAEAVLIMAKENKEAWNNAFDEAYKSYATHRLGVTQPLIPTNVFQVDPRILDDEDWLFLEASHDDMDVDVDVDAEDAGEDDSDSEGEDLEAKAESDAAAKAKAEAKLKAAQEAEAVAAEAELKAAQAAAAQAEAEEPAESNDSKGLDPSVVNKKGN